jgi:hypothetical protein
MCLGFLRDVAGIKQYKFRRPGASPAQAGDKIAQSRTRAYLDDTAGLAAQLLEAAQEFAIE